MHVSHRTAAILAALATALACAGPVGAAAAETSASAGGAAAPGAPPAQPQRPIRPSGVATWFGPGFYGHKTACGQTLTQQVVGVANRTLPCGTLVRVSYHAHAITLPVLDRGPYSHIADWDLTAGAAQALGITDTVRIHTRIVGRAPNTATLGLPPGAPSPLDSGGVLAG